MARRLVLLAALLLTQGAAAETRALLVGVSDYENQLTGLDDLQGPANDVRLMRQVLEQRGVTDIRVLADAVEGGARPARAAILDALAQLAADSAPGDFVYLHFSGHGTRQPDPEGDETDGQDEVFLAADTGRAPRNTGLIPGAIVDDEIGQAVSAIRARGADVWLVLDSCNSGSGLRAGQSGMATRFVDPAALGVDLASSYPRDSALDDGGVPDLPGGYLAFYAARSSESAREVDMGGGAFYGLFTAKLAARLQDSGAISFRQLFQAVLSDLNDTALPGIARLQTPSWEGTLIDAAVFAGASTAGLRRFRLRDDEIEAGTVHGLAEGMLMGLVADAADPPDAILGYAQVELIEPTHAFLRPVAESCQPSAATPCPEEGTLPRGARFAQVVARPLDLVTRLAPPLNMDGTPLAEDAPPMPALRDAMARAEATGQLLVFDPLAWDVQVLWDGASFWFGPRAVIGGTPVGLKWTPGAAPLAPLLVRIAQAESLARALSAVAGEASALDPNPVALTAQIVASDASRLAQPGAPVSPARECRRAQAQAAAPAPLPVGADIKQCDVLGFAVQGTEPGARDVNRVYIDAQYCIRVDHELVEDVSAARRLGPEMTMCSDCPGGYAAGEERMFVIVTEAAENAEPLNLEGILDTCTSGGTRGPAGAAALERLTAAARRPRTRGSFGGFGASGIWVESLNWRVLPRTEALARFGPLAAAE